MDIYKQYYLSDDKIEMILKEGIIVFDTSALLDLYYYSESSQIVIFDKIFGYLSKRLWIPAQVYFEFLKNKDGVAEKPIVSYENLLHKPKSNDDGGHVDKMVVLSKEFPKCLDKIQNQLKTLKEKTSHEDKYPYVPEDTYIDIDKLIVTFETQMHEFITNIEVFSEEIKNVIDNKIALIKEEIEKDRVLKAINEQFNIGKELSYEQQLKISKEGAFRYSEHIPPGYEDSDEKEGMQKYGDLFAWKQILKMASEEKKPVLLIINDVKEDWHDDKLNAPRFELLKEFRSVCKQSFWTYTMKQFLYHMNQIIETDQKVFDQMIEETDEIETVKKNDASNDVDYIDMVNDYLNPEIDVDTELPLNDDWQIIGHTKIYTGITGGGMPALVMVNRIKGTNYTSFLNPLRNMRGIKTYFDKKMIRYEYTQFIIASSESSAKKIISNHKNKTNIKGYFMRKDVNIIIGYIKDNGFKCFTSNMEYE